MVNANFRQLADIRFKLLAFVPLLGGAANYVLSQSALNPTSANPPHFGLSLLGGVIGFLVTFGIVMYDQRNSQLYNSLFGRAKQLEGRLGITGGQFAGRPAASRRLLGLFLAKHDHALALIYASVLGSWFFPIVYSGLMTVGLFEDHYKRVAAVASALVVGLIFLIDLLRLDGAWRRKTQPTQPAAAPL
jgi:hypothetical protein